MNFVILPGWLQRGNAVKFSLGKEATTHLTYIECTDVSSLAQHATEDFFFFKRRKKMNHHLLCLGMCRNKRQLCTGVLHQDSHGNWGAALSILFCLNTLPSIAWP